MDSCVDVIRMLLLAGAIGTTMVEGILAGARAEHAEAILASSASPEDANTEASVEETFDEPDPKVALAFEPEFDPVLTIDVDLNEPLVYDEELVLDHGVRIGAFGFEPNVYPEEPEPEPQSARPRPRVPLRPPGPRLHSDPGIHTILTARRMMSSGEEIHGSCYAYLSEVFARAGHNSWRKRRIVYRQGKTGPYANLDLIRTGDWLYIVTDPGRTPVGTHSVMFVRWEDKARGYASVISHPGWFAGPHTGRESTYDVTRTYRIIRPTN